MTSEDKYVNFYKMRYFGRDCKIPDYKLLEKKNTSNAGSNYDNLPKPQPHNQ